MQFHETRDLAPVVSHHAFVLSGVAVGQFNDDGFQIIQLGGVAVTSLI